MSALLAFAALLAMLAISYGIAWLSARGRPLPTPRGRTGCLDGLRGYLALSVVAHHFLRVWNDARSGSMVLPDSNVVYQNLGPTAVMLFFMITALLFYGKIVATQGRIDWFALYVSRIFRLTPAYWVVLAIMLLLLMTLQGWALKEPPVRVLAEVAHWMAFTVPGSPEVNAYPETGSLLAGVIWTLRYEWLFYLALPLLAFVVAVAGRVRSARLAIIVICSGIVGFGPDIIVLHLSSAFMLPFLLGMISAELASFPSVSRIARGSGATWVGIAALVAMLVCPPDLALIWRAPLLIVFFLTVVAGNSYFGLLARPPSVVLGDASYSIYLLHGLTLNTVSLLFGTDVYASRNGLSGWVMLPAIAAVVVVLAIVNYRVVESHFIDLGRDWLRSRREQPVLAKIAP